MMKFNRIRRAAMIGMMLGAALSFVAAQSQAAQAIFDWQDIQRGLAAGTSPPIAAQSSKASWSQGDPMIATVGASAAQPITALGSTPTIMWPANNPVFDRNESTMFGGMGTFTPNGIFNPTSFSPFGFYFSGSGVQTRFNEAATMKKFFNLTAGETTSIFGTPSNAWPVGTTRCATLISAFTGTPSSVPTGPGTQPRVDECVPKVGTVDTRAGAKRFGGTLKLAGSVVQTAISLSGLFAGFSYIVFYGDNKANPAYVQNESFYIDSGGLYKTNITTGIPYRELFGVLQGAWTTGMAHVANSAGFVFTDFTRTGSNTFNTANLTGTILMIQPQIGNSWVTLNNAVFAAGQVGSAGLRETRVRFAGEVPEPGFTALLGMGVLGLAGVYARRKSE